MCAKLRSNITGVIVCTYTAPIQLLEIQLKRKVFITSNSFYKFNIHIYYT